MSKENGNPKVQVVHFAIGLDLIGSKTSLSYTKYDIEATAIGIKAMSRTTGRTIVVPYSNVKGFELLPEGGVSALKAPSQLRTEQAMEQALGDMAKVKLAKQKAEIVGFDGDDEEELAIKAAEARKAARKLAKEAGLKALAEDAAKNK